MSRSSRKTPKIGNLSSGVRLGEKKNKQKANRKLRRLTKEEIRTIGETKLTIRNVSDVWLYEKDGKTYIGNLDEKIRKKALRK